MKAAFYLLLIGIVQTTLCFGDNPKVLGVGAPCMDIIIHVNEAFVKELGGKGGSQQTDMQSIHDTINRAEPHLVSFTPGGSCANSVKGLAGLGQDCSFFGKIGEDTFGEHFVKNLHHWDIESVIGKSTDHGTQICLCLITPDGERTMRCYSGASEDVNPDDLTPELFKDRALVMFEGYSLYIKDHRYIDKAMKLAKEEHALVSMDLSSFEVVKSFKDRINNLLENYVDIVFANSDEAKALTGLSSYEACEKMQEKCKIAIVMMGKNGCYVGSEGKIVHCPAFQCDVIDTTGAGDLFASGFLHGVLKGLPLDQCGHNGNSTGSAVCEMVGAEISAQKWIEVKQKVF